MSKLRKECAKHVSGMRHAAGAGVPRPALPRRTLTTQTTAVLCMAVIVYMCLFFTFIGNKQASKCSACVRPTDNGKDMHVSTVDIHMPSASASASAQTTRGTTWHHLVKLEQRTDNNIAVAMGRLTKVVLLATHCHHVASVLATALHAAGIPVVTLGQKRASGTVFKPGHGVVVLVTGPPYGIPKSLQVLYVVRQPIAAAAHSLLQAGQDPSSACEDVYESVQSWQKEVGMWLDFGRDANFTVLHYEDAEQHPDVFVEQLRMKIGLSLHVNALLKRTLADASRLLDTDSQAVQPIIKCMCRAIQSMQVEQQPWAIGCYASPCNEDGSMFAQPCKAASLDPRDADLTKASIDITEFADPRFAQAVLNSPRRHVVPRRRVCIVTTYHISKDNARRQEYDLALRANLQNPYVDEVHVIVSINDSMALPFKEAWAEKLVVKYQESQPTYKQLFTYANVHLHGHLVVLTNSDIVFTSSIDHIHSLAAPNVVFGLSRHMVYSIPYAGGIPNCAPVGFEKYHNNSWQNFCFHYEYSHDTFVFIPPMSAAVVSALDYVPNRLGAEDLTIIVLAKHKYTVLNPCKTIAALHVHCSPVRTYNDSYVVPKHIIPHTMPLSSQPHYLSVCNAPYCVRPCWGFDETHGTLIEVYCPLSTGNWTTTLTSVPYEQSASNLQPPVFNSNTFMSARERRARERWKRRHRQHGGLGA